MSEIIKAENLSFSYNKSINVLENVSFAVNEKDFVGLIGPNGGGKSTLLKLILGLLKPDQGQLEVFGQNPQVARDKIGYVPQYVSVDLDYPISVFEVVMSGLLGKKPIGSRTTPDDKKKVNEVLGKMNLDALSDRSIGGLSGGQRQRVFLSRALVRDPKLLLLDEPTNNVDRSSGSDLYELLNKLNQEITIIIVSHDIGVISKHINRIFCLNKNIVCDHADCRTCKECGDSDFKHVLHDKNCIIHNT
jgi:zinc transport system ATP-binding protein